MTHTMQLSILADKEYKASASAALNTIDQCFRKQIVLLQTAHEQCLITEKQLLRAQKKILAEAASILYTRQPDDPEKILFKLKIAAEELDRQTHALSAENCFPLLGDL